MLPRPAGWPPGPAQAGGRPRGEGEGSDPRPPRQERRAEPGSRAPRERLLEAWRLPRRFGLVSCWTSARGDLAGVRGESGTLNLESRCEARPRRASMVLRRESRLLGLSFSSGNSGRGLGGGSGSVLRVWRSLGRGFGQCRAGAATEPVAQPSFPAQV